MNYAHVPSPRNQTHQLHPATLQMSYTYQRQNSSFPGFPPVPDRLPLIVPQAGHASHLTSGRFISAPSTHNRVSPAFSADHSVTKDGKPAATCVIRSRDLFPPSAAAAALYREPKMVMLRPEARRVTGPTRGIHPQHDAFRTLTGRTSFPDLVLACKPVEDQITRAGAQQLTADNGSSAEALHAIAATLATSPWHANEQAAYAAQPLVGAFSPLLIHQQHPGVRPTTAAITPTPLSTRAKPQQPVKTPGQAGGMPSGTQPAPNTKRVLTSSQARYASIQLNGRILRCESAEGLLRMVAAHRDEFSKVGTLEDKHQRISTSHRTIKFGTWHQICSIMSLHSM